MSGESACTMSLRHYVSSGNLEVLKRYVENCSHQVDFNEKDCWGCTPLLDASSRGYTDIVHYLQEKGARLKVKDSSNSSALNIAAQHGHLELCEYLVEQGLGINEPDKNGNTAFLLACANNFESVAMYLAVNGADVEVTDQSGNTAIDYAYRHGFGEKIDPEPSKRIHPHQLHLSQVYLKKTPHSSPSPKKRPSTASPVKYRIKPSSPDRHSPGRANLFGSLSRNSKVHGSPTSADSWNFCVHLVGMNEFICVCMCAFMYKFVYMCMFGIS